MTTTVVTTLILSAMLGTGVVHPSQLSAAASDPARHLTHKQVQMINAASTPDDHHKLAQYFRQEAGRQREKEQYNMEMEATYRLHPLRVDANQNISTADRYKHWAAQARDTALTDDQMAIVQEKLAEGLAQSK